MPDQPVSDGSDREALRPDTPIDRVRALLASYHEVLDDAELMIASETAYCAGDFKVAVVAMEIAISRHPRDPHLHYRAGVCLENAKDFDRAGHRFRTALELDPDFESCYSSLANVLVAQGDLVGAIGVVERQQERLGTSPALLGQRASLLVMADRLDEALALLEHQNTELVATDETLRLEAELALRVGRRKQAVQAAFKAWRLRSDSSDLCYLLASLLCHERRFAPAIFVLEEALARDPGNAGLAELLVSAHTEQGEFQNALRVLIRLISADPTVAARWHRTAVLANLLGAPEQAVGSMRRAIALQPDDAMLRLAFAHLLSHLGRVDEAVAQLDAAQSLGSTDRSLVDLRVALLQQREHDAVPVTGTRSDLIKPLPRVPNVERARARRASDGGFAGLMNGFRVEMRVLGGLVMRDLSHRTAHSRFGLLSAVIEPFIQVAMLGLVLGIFTHGRPPLGTDIFFFYTTGVLPFYVFLHVVNHSLNIFVENQNVLQIPIINRLDLVISTSLAALLIDGTTTVLVFTCFHLLGKGSFSDNILDAVLAYLFVWLLACGIGLNVAVLNNLSKITERVWQTAQRILYFISGIFFLASGMPDWLRVYLVWNPLLICVEWFRAGFFPQYDPPWLDRSYVAAVCFGLIVSGLMLERALSSRLRTI